jgi:putative ABC transport system substrate-binding protein
LGLVASLNRPSANLTGSTVLMAELAPKRLQLLHELIPNAAVFGVLVDPAFPTAQSTVAELQAAARALGLQLVVVNARTESDLEPAFATFSQQRVGAVLVGRLPRMPGSTTMRGLHVSCDIDTRRVAFCGTENAEGKGQACV